MFEAVPIVSGPVDLACREPAGRSAVEGGVADAVAELVAGAEGLLTRLATTTPSPRLVEELATVDTSAVDDATLLEAMAAWEKVTAWAASRNAVVVNELRRRREAQGRGAFVGDEIAAHLGTTRAAGENAVAAAWCLERVPVVWDALDAGRIDTRKAAVLAEELLALPFEVRSTVAWQLVPKAEHLTVPQLRARVRRAALEQDPTAGERAQRRERAARYVALEPVRDGMAWLHAYLPGPEAVAVHTTLTAIADAQGSDDGRPMDARRADALVDVVTRWLDAGTCPDGTPLPRRQRRRPHLQVTVAASTLAGLDDAPAELAGYGPITADVARQIAATATWSALGIDPVTGEARARPTGRQARGPAPRLQPGRPPGQGRGGGSPGTPRYRPPAALADEVIARDVTCTFPGCRTPAHRCDIDHIEPFDPARPAVEQTLETNLHALCRHHHNLKTHGAWQARRDEGTGRTSWTAPTGHRYLREPIRAAGGDAGDGGDAGASGAGPPPH